MRRFETGEQVLVGRFMGEACAPPRCGVVRKVYGARSSMLFDYLVQVEASEYPVRDEWLSPVTIIINEDLEWLDLTVK
ncbi:MAG TPA: hypothetical protein VFH56_02805 [Acidimicrobiales bacterium]|nr:hypothetical protein [Acidimicrobiales bacterium]